MSDIQNEDGQRPEVLILLATFNGARYLPEQLASVERQTYPRWNMLVSDDGSTDTTPQLLEDFRARHADRVAILKGSGPHSAKGNFFRLLREAPAVPYVAFCDQDDVWMETKLDELVAACQRLEGQLTPGTPCAVFSDLRVVDEDLRLQAPSFFRQTNARPDRISFGSLLVENAIPGCSMLINQALVREFRSFPGDLKDARMHDWWLSLLAAGLGALAFVPAQLVLYRQHSRNAAGSVHRTGLAFAWAKLVHGDRNDIKASIAQARLLLAAHGSRLPEQTRRRLSAFASLVGSSKLHRVFVCLRHRILKETVDRRIYQLMRI